MPGFNPTANPHALGRCGYGPRLPLLVISPWSKENFVDHTVTDQTSVIHFIEDNWLGGQRIGNGSFDALSGPINNMFDFSHIRFDGRLFLDPNKLNAVRIGFDQKKWACEKLSHARFFLLLVLSW